MLHELAICSGVGMLSEGLRAGLAHLGIQTRTVCHIEREAYAASVLVARMQEGSLDGAPIWSDLLTFDGAAWRGSVDCIAAGFPCQDLSLAGKRAGLDGARSGLFFNILDIADACGARYLFLENVAGIASATATVMDEAEGALEERAAARVLGELADRGWHAEWLTLSASDVGASHGRSRWFCWAWRVGHTGLQYQQLQQWEDGAEHPGAGEPVAYAQHGTGRAQHEHQSRQRAAQGPDHGTESWSDGKRSLAHAERAERWPECAGGIGSIQGHDTGGREAHGGAGESGAVLGHANGERTHRSRPPEQQAGCAESTHTSGCLADAECPCDRSESETADCRESQAIGPADRSGGYCCALSNTCSTGLPQRVSRGGLCDQSNERIARPDPELCGCPLFAPGPADNRWPAIIARSPWLSPALSIEGEHDAKTTFQTAQSLLRGAPDGLAHRLDFSHRAQRLKCVGNGVVAAQAGCAVVILIQRSGVKPQ